MKKCLLVLGMHRSGTSALTGVLNILGLDGVIDDNVVRDDNLKGHFEHQQINFLNDEILTLMYSSWHDISLLPENWWERADVQAFKSKAKELVSLNLSNPQTDIFLLKDPRISILLPFWLEVFKEMEIQPYGVISVRHPIEVANSLSKRDKMVNQKSFLIWAKHLMDSEYYSREFPRVFVAYDDLLNNTKQLIESISTTLGVDLDYAQKEEQIDNFLEKGLRHSKVKENDKIKGYPKLDEYYELLMNSLYKEVKGEDLNKFDEYRTAIKSLINDAPLGYLKFIDKKNIVFFKIKREIRRLFS